MHKRICVVGLLLATVGCGQNAATTLPLPSPAPTAPTPSPPPPALTTFHLTGIVTDDDGTPVAGARVTVYPWVVSQPSQSQPLVTTTDSAGTYNVDFDATRYMNHPYDWIGTARIEKSGYESTVRYAYPTTAIGSDAILPFHLYRVRRVAVGESVTLVIVPGDGTCGSEDEFICRTVRVVAPTDGTLTLATEPASAHGQNLGLEVFVGIGGFYRCCSNTTSFHVSAGTEVVANVGIYWESTASQAFTLNTSLQPD